jgi:hypothetical protein
MSWKTSRQLAMQNRFFKGLQVIVGRRPSHSLSSEGLPIASDMALEVKNESHPVKQFFSIDKIANNSMCLIDPLCDRHVKPLMGHHSGNLLRHVKRYHVSEINQITEQLRKWKAPKRKLLDEEENQLKKITVLYSVSQLKDGCVEMVTTNGRPFSALADSGFQKTIAPITEPS